MKVFPLASVCLVQLLAQHVVASGLIVEFNQDLAVDRSVLLSASGAAHARSMKLNSTLLALDGTPLATDRDYFLHDNPGATWPWENETPPTPEDSVTPEEASAPENATSTTEETTTAGTEDAVSLVSRELVAATSADTVPCSNSDSTPSAPKVRVLVLISDCSTSDFPWIERWVDNLANEDSRYFMRGAASKIEYVKRYLPACLNRLTGGRIRFHPLMRKPDNTIGAIAFATGPVSLLLASTYLKFRNIDTLIGFQNKWVVPRPILGFNYYSDEQSLSAYNPYSAIRLLHCANLANGVPTSYVDTTGKRQCYCSCPSGFKKSGNKCVADPDPNCACEWGKEADGFTFEILKDEEDKYSGAYGECSISGLANSGHLPVPHVVDNYVAHNRVNDGDDNVGGPYMTGPRVELEQTKEGVSVRYEPNQPNVNENRQTSDPETYTWMDFQKSSADKVNALEMTKVGKYSVELTAWDYSLKKAQCEACVLVVDKRRPSINDVFSCPNDGTGNTKTSLTKTNLKMTQDAVDGVKKLKDNADNDPCGTNKRCDCDTHKLKKFVDANYGTEASNHHGVGSVFSEHAVKADLKERLAVSPFDSSQPNGLAATVTELCARCISVSTKLKEWWTPYKCGSGPVQSSCEGDDDATCLTEQCIQVNGETIATATTAINSDVAANSKTVVKHLTNDADMNDATLKTEYSLDTTIHVALHCTEYVTNAPSPMLLGDDENAQITPDDCSYTAKVSDLIDISASWAALGADALFQSEDEVKDYVSWRYEADDGGWKAWDVIDTETFYNSESTITVQAWTPCGIVKEVKYLVKLHLNNPIDVCEHFPKMWYQTTSPPLLSTPNSFCMFPKSDFAEVTFDYHPNIGLNFDVDRFQMSISQVVCTVKYLGHEGEAVTVVDTSAYGIDSGLESLEIVKQFAIDGVDMLTTKEDTDMFVECDFTYTRKPDDKTVIHRCPLQFVIKDCTPPEISKPCELDGHCEFNKCSIAGSDKRDLFQACEGNRITQGSDGNTKLDTTTATCCDSCDDHYTTTCELIQDFPGGKASQFTPVKRCEAFPTPSYNLMAGAVAEQSEVQSNTMTALVGVSAMVAVVALVVVVRRRAVAKVPVDDDAYYALLG